MPAIRFYYSDTISAFLNRHTDEIIGKMAVALSLVKTNNACYNHIFRKGQKVLQNGFYENHHPK